MSQTVPDASQILSAVALSSTSISFKWSNVRGADRYVLIVEVFKLPQVGEPQQVFNSSFTDVMGQVGGLNSSTRYICYIYSHNDAGYGAKSSSKIVITCTSMLSLLLLCLLLKRELCHFSTGL